VQYSHTLVKIRFSRKSVDETFQKRVKNARVSVCRSREHTRTRCDCVTSARSPVKPFLKRTSPKRSQPAAAVAAAESYQTWTSDRPTDTTRVNSRKPVVNLFYVSRNIFIIIIIIIILIYCLRPVWVSEYHAPSPGRRVVFMTRIVYMI